MYCSKYDGEYYVDECYAKIPLRWMAWEAVISVISFCDQPMNSQIRRDTSRTDRLFNYSLIIVTDAVVLLRIAHTHTIEYSTFKTKMPY